MQRLRRFVFQAFVDICRMLKLSSTWQGTDVSELDFDKVVLNEDPGCFKVSYAETNNVRRQICSTLNGIKESSAKYVLKIRSDMALSSASFLHFFDKFNCFDEKWHFLKKRIIVPSHVSRDPRIWESPMCPSDWCSFGLREDMLSLWDIEYPTEEEELWFINRERTAQVNYHYNILQCRYNPEQTIWIGFVKKFVKVLHTDNMFDINKESIYETLKSFANNLIILSPRQYGVKFLKQSRRKGDTWHIITYNRFIKIYNKYAGGHKIAFPIDFQRWALLKHFKQSQSRLFRLARRSHNIAGYLIKELKYESRILYCLFLPFLRILSLKEQDWKENNKPELWWKFHTEQIPMFAIVVPSHSRLDLLKQTLDSIEMQTNKNYELIVTDDSPDKLERKQIKQRLMSLYDKGINVKYIFTEPNLGQSKNVNQGLNHVRAKWTRILHSDDIISPHLLEYERRLIKVYPNIFAITHKVSKFSDNYDWISEDPSYDVFDADFIIHNALHSFCALPSSLLFKTEIISEIGKYNPDLKRACDWDFWARLVLSAEEHMKDILYVSAHFIFYRMHSRSNRNNLEFALVNFMEYKQIADNVVRYMRRNFIFGSEFFAAMAFVYRQQRLSDDFNSLPVYWKIRKFRQYLRLKEDRLRGGGVKR